MIMLVWAGLKLWWRRLRCPHPSWKFAFPPSVFDMLPPLQCERCGVVMEPPR